MLIGIKILLQLVLLLSNIDLNMLKITTSSFLKELQQSDLGNKTSLPFIINQIPSSPLVKENTLFQVFIVGGSNFQKALVKKQNEKFEILKQEQKNQTIFKTKSQFLSFIEQEIEHNIEVISLNFAYPLQPVFEEGKLDGILLNGSKEHIFDGLVGKKVGFEIEQYIAQKQKRKIKVTIANDTICLLLAGLTRYNSEELAAGIVGTGLNFALFLNKEKVVNLEAANFSKFTPSEEAKQIDNFSEHPGKALFEKETAGAYLYKHLNIIIKKGKIDFPLLSSTENLNELASKNTPLVSEIAQKLLDRSAQLVACQVAGIIEFKKRDMIFVMEGSLFWKGNKYKETLEKTVTNLTNYKVQFIEIPNSGILGAAKLLG